MSDGWTESTYEPAPSKAPTAKVTTAAVAGSLVTVVVAAVASLGVDVPGEVTGALVVLASFALSYVVPERG